MQAQFGWESVGRGSTRGAKKRLQELRSLGTGFWEDGLELAPASTNGISSARFHFSGCSSGPLSAEGNAPQATW